MSDQLGPDFDRRLKAGLDRFEGPNPLPSSARFSRSPTAPHRLGPIKLALAAAGALAVLTVAASALAGGPDPSAWPQKAVNSFELVTHIAQPSPSPSPTRSPQAQGRPAAHATPSDSKHESPEPSEGSHAQPSPSPTPESTSHDSSNAGPSPTPSPGSDDGGQRGSPSPSPSGSQD